ncbi:isatin hydrolase [Patella vulgata]|uniref:isatin hydrolase n=1 Tax=Patella vulgata TaxID=6465 RepID=UPI0024A7B801|nr:isatin hydrolase [Patella vulgata]XP_050414237.2 isatin hydrolase [Patella vulgata]XP_050414239.2 isatin hydrolase [Patella vulgata]XP_050414240.2 isatin hydrolase [Patella vulgata]XP_050414241.2 isatin hydrolase [Patella vulgata]XP_050414242.2 isatin hydrolase [Patella vulgata]XP_050414243.2 isatin hydrolase [Patella vulgata]XP_050414246.2 isatin hydrolase [Patella vulgata]XP_050414247.2 isatin hydrolase [Patella vulgata]
MIGSEATPLLLLISLDAAMAIFYHGENARVVDLTFTMNASSIYWPGSPDFNFTILNRNEVGTHWYETNYFATAEHGGTHLDAPAHFSKGKWRTHEIPVERLVGPGVIIDVTSKATTDHDYRVQISDIEVWETKYGNIPEGAIVLMTSGWTKRYPDKGQVFGSENTTNPETFHFPAFHEDAVEWLIQHRNISIVGVDTPSVDYGQTKTFPVHQLLGANNIIGLENVAYLDKVPEHGAIIFAGVTKLYDGSGGPARVIAIYTTDSSTYNTLITIGIITVVLSLLIFRFCRL